MPFDPAVHDTTGFDCGDPDLIAKRYQEYYLSHTRLAFSRGALVGYITLPADSIILKTPEKRRLVDFHRSVFTFPALKVGRLGVEVRFHQSGVG